jgi:hypothetical protein
LTGSALCAAFAPSNPAAATLANSSFNMRMKLPPDDDCPASGRF